MPRFDQTGPPSGAKGPRDGRGGGKGWAPGKGIGLMAGGQMGLFNPIRIKQAKAKKKNQKS